MPGGYDLSLHTGVISLGGDPIEVTIGLADGRVILESGGDTIGDWSEDECQILADGPGKYLISAESEDLPFLPDDPAEFDRVLSGTGDGTEETVPERAQSVSSTSVYQPSITFDPSPFHVEEAAPKTTTMLGFYFLAVVTALLGLWAVWTLVA